MKAHITKKECKAAYMYYCGYCELQHLLSNEYPAYYNWSKINGWNCDIYRIEIKGIYYYICTGYNSFGNKKIPWEVCKKYEDMAKEINNKSIFKSYENYAEAKKQLIYEMLKECGEEGE